MARITPQDLIAFEDRIRTHWEAGNLPCLLHLCGGNEEQLIRIFQDINEGDWVFSTHRNHYHALLAGLSPEELEQSILNGNSMFTYSSKHNFVCSAILAGTCGIAVGVAVALKEEKSPHKVICFIGDGGEEEGHFYEAVLYAESQKLPLRFIVEDNGRQVDTGKQSRRGTGLRTNRPLDSFSCVSRYEYQANYPHAGSGSPPGSIKFNPDAINRLKP